MIVAQKDMTIKGKLVKKGKEVVGVPKQELNALLRSGAVVEQEQKTKEQKDK